LFIALSRGNVDILMGVWTSDYPELWGQMTKSGKVTAVAINFTGLQGWYIPAYMVEGDAERGIEPEIPAFKSVADLTVYQPYFKLSATNSQGVIENAPQGWPAVHSNNDKLNAYALTSSFALLPSASEDQLAASLDKAYGRGDAWLGYARVPGLISAEHKLWQVREPPYSEERWLIDRGCSYPETNVMIAANFALNKTAPEVLDFLHNYKTTRGQNEEMLAYLNRFAGDRNKAVDEWLLANPDVWGQWIPEQVAKKVWND